MHIPLLTVSSYELLERPSYLEANYISKPEVMSRVYFSTRSTVRVKVENGGKFTSKK